jgi:hypothetical protein
MSNSSNYRVVHIKYTSSSHLRTLLFGLILSIFCILPNQSRAQANILCGLQFGQAFNTMDFISVNSLTGQTNTVTTLVNTAALFLNVNSSINYAAGRYYYVGQYQNDLPSDFRLLEIDGLTGTILNSTITGGDLGELSFHVPSQKLYGVRFLPNSIVQFVSITPITLQITVIDTLPLVASIVSTTGVTDAANGRYIVNGSYLTDTGNTIRMFSIDINTGAILSDPITSATFFGCEFNSNTGIVYGLEAMPTLAFAGINPTTGLSVFNYPFTYAQSMLIPSSVYNPVTDDYLFAGYSSNDPNNNLRLFTVDAASGQIVVDTIIPDYIFAFEIFKGSEIIGVEESTNSISSVAFPNPAHQQVSITCAQTLPTQAQISLTDIAGKNVQVAYAVSGNRIQLQLDALASGMYFYTIQAAEGFVSSGKFCVE